MTSSANPWFCYLLVSQDANQRTYIGATVDPDRRLQQHNGVKSGGARATAGREWRRMVLVGGFPSQTAALQFEWAWKFHSRREARHGLPGRLAALWKLLDSPQSTSKAAPFSDWPSPPTIMIAA